MKKYLLILAAILLLWGCIAEDRMYKSPRCLRQPDGTARKDVLRNSLCG